MLRTAIVEDEIILKDLLGAILKNDGNFEVVGSYERGEDLLKEIHEIQPEILITDYRLPGLNGAEIVKRVKNKHPETRCVLLSAYFSVKSIDQALKSGAEGMIEKGVSLQEMVDTLHRISQGESYYSNRIINLVREAMRRPQRDNPLSLLSTREREILRHIAEGYSTRQIAEQLKITTKTAETHRAHITRKLNIRGIADLTRFAIAEGLVSIES